MSIFKVAGLPDFLKVEGLNRLRNLMGATIIEPIADLRIDVLTIEQILRTTGQEVNVSDVEFASDGTLLFQGRRVILYIRDVAAYQQRITLPKFHLANCSKLQEMWERNRSARYVVATRHDGLFRLNITFDGQTWDKQERALDVCKICLGKLDWEHYSAQSNGGKRSVFERFSLIDFFKLYPISPITYDPIHSDLTAALNKYSDNFSEISQRYRASVNWVCEGCKSDLSSYKLRMFLHVHHVDGIKSNNLLANLRALCIKCHASQDGHDHMRHMKDLAEYQGIVQSLA